MKCFIIGLAALLTFPIWAPFYVLWGTVEMLRMLGEMIEESWRRSKP